MERRYHTDSEVARRRKGSARGSTGIGRSTNSGSSNSSDESIAGSTGDVQSSNVDKGSKASADESAGLDRSRHSIDFSSMMNDGSDDQLLSNSPPHHSSREARNAEACVRPGGVSKHWPRNTSMESIEMKLNDVEVGTFDRSTSLKSSLKGREGSSNKSAVDQDVDDDESVVTIQSVDTLLNMMHMSLDDDWWNARTYEWEQSKAKPVAPLLQTKEDKEIVKKQAKEQKVIFYKKQKGGKWCGGVHNCCKNMCKTIQEIRPIYKVIWVIFFLLMITGTVLLFTTEYGSLLIEDLEEMVRETENTIGHSKGEKVKAWDKLEAAREVEKAYEDQGGD